jgi:mono/diheme cytochrome c family protein
MRTKIVACGFVSLAAAAFAASPIALAQTADAASAQVKRGEYLVNYGGCNDCHTPKVMTPQGPEPDKTRLLSGHRPACNCRRSPGCPRSQPQSVGAITNNDFDGVGRPVGVSFAANLTPDATGIGNWTTDQFIKTMRTGKRFGTGRPILPPMPWFALAVLTDQDLKAVFAYLKSIKPISNPVSQPIPPGT